MLVDDAGFDNTIGEEYAILLHKPKIIYSLMLVSYHDR